MEKIEKDGVSVEFVDVTPDLAKQWLGVNQHNRNMRFRLADSYAADIAEDDWDLNGETIKFATDGRLLDGQHRLQAIVDSNKTVQLIVVRGLDPRTQATMDRGAVRKFGDVLKLDGETNAIGLAAAVRAVTGWKKGFRRAGSFSPSVKQLMHTLEQHPELRDIVSRAQIYSSRCGIPASVLALCMWVFGQIEPEEAELFFIRLSDGVGLQRGNPIYELRKQALEARTNRGHRSAVIHTAVTIKAWNIWRRGDTVTNLSFKAGGSTPEKFPEPI